MRKLRVFIVELILVGVCVAWVFEKVPHFIDKGIPWIVFAIFWHLTWEIPLEWMSVKKCAVDTHRKWGRMAWVICFLIGGLISVGFLYSAKKIVAAIKEEPKATSNEKPSEQGKTENKDLPHQRDTKPKKLPANETERTTFKLPVDLPNELRNRIRQKISEAPGSVGLIVDLSNARTQDSGNVLESLFEQAGWKVNRTNNSRQNFAIVTDKGSFSITEPLACLVNGTGNASSVIAKKAFADSRLFCNWYNFQLGAFLSRGQAGVDLEIIIQAENR